MKKRKGTYTYVKCRDCKYAMLSIENILIGCSKNIYCPSVFDYVKKFKIEGLGCIFGTRRKKLAQRES